MSLLVVTVSGFICVTIWHQSVNRHLLFRMCLRFDQVYSHDWDACHEELPHFSHFSKLKFAAEFHLGRSTASGWPFAVAMWTVVGNAMADDRRFAARGPRSPVAVLH